MGNTHNKDTKPIKPTKPLTINEQLKSCYVCVESAFIKRVESNPHLKTIMAGVLLGTIDYVDETDSDQCLIKAIGLKYHEIIFHTHYSCTRITFKKILILIIKSMKLNNIYAESVFKTMISDYEIYIQDVMQELYNIKHLKENYQHIINFLVSIIVKRYKVKYDTVKYYYKSYKIVNILTDDYYLIKETFLSLDYDFNKLFFNMCIKRMFELNYDDTVITLKILYEETDDCKILRRRFYMPKSNDDIKTMLEHNNDDDIIKYLTNNPTIAKENEIYSTWLIEYERIKSLIT